MGWEPDGLSSSLSPNSVCVCVCVCVCEQLLYASSEQNRCGSSPRSGRKQILNSDLRLRWEKCVMTRNLVREDISSLGEEDELRKGKGSPRK